MRRLSIIIITLFLFAIPSCSQWELRDSIEFQQRSGLPNFFNKIKNNKPVIVGFIGGSITRANGWRPKTITWLKEYYQTNNIVDYSAAISGTNSKFGAFRINRHLLAKNNFDLIFVEFAVNDRDGVSSDVERSMEAIVRKIWKSNPYTDICFVYTVSKKFFPDIENGKMNLSASKHDIIASYYGIPSIFWGVKVDKLLNTDEVVWNDKITNQTTSQNANGQYVFATDIEHPTNYGHQVYTDVLASSFKKMDSNRAIIKHEIKTPMLDNNFEDSQYLPLSPASNHGMEVVDSKGEKEYLDKLLNTDTWFLASNDPSAYYSFSFVGSEFGISEIRGPSTGHYIIEIDGVKREYDSFDSYCSYWRVSYTYVKLSKNSEHFVKIYPSPTSLTLAEKRTILSPESRKVELDENPNKYEGNELIFSGILIDGDLSNFHSETINACDGEIIHWHGKELTKNGQYTASYETVNGLDSIFELNLKILPTYTLISNDTIYQGDSILWENQYYKDPGQYEVIYQTVAGCDSSRVLNLSYSILASSLDEKTQNTIRVFPNPTANSISLIFSKVLHGISNLTLTNLHGEIMHKETLTNEFINKSIDLSNYPPGMYFLNVNNKGIEFYARVIKL